MNSVTTGIIRAEIAHVVIARGTMSHKLNPLTAGFVLVWYKSIV